MRPAVQAETAILLPPAGQVSFDTHRTPVRIEARVTGVDIGKAEALIYDDGALADLERTASESITDAAIRNALTTALCTAVGATVATGLGHRRVRDALVAGGSAAALAVTGAGLTGVTFQAEALAQPRFEGLLSQAAYVADLGSGTLADYASYRGLLAEFVGQVSALYVAADSLPTASGVDTMTVLHVSDIHDNPQAFDVIRQLNQQFGLDLVIDTGDIVSWGTPMEHQLLSEIGTLGVPYVFVTGNHDGAATAAAVAANSNATVLENQVVTVGGLEIAGIGDPRFAADDDSDAGGKAAAGVAVENAGFQLGDTVEEYDAAHPDDPVDIVLFHDPTHPAGLLGRAPLVLSGHMHTPKVELDREGSGTDWLTNGSTGGALASGGVRPVLDGGDPLNLSARLLHIDPETGRLLAYDDITMGGLGLVSVSISRHQMPAEAPPLEVPEGAESPDAPIPEQQRVRPGEGLPDADRVTAPGGSSDGG
ncbi:metallophosphoesterase [Brachybacterium sp. EF45031]|nr:metallophosphoesterase [Brachybacterium sillae]